MNTYAHIHGELDSDLNARILRVTIGLGVAGTFLTGIWTSPAWIFTASVLSIYMVASAILNRSLVDAFSKSANEEAAAPTDCQKIRRGNIGRAARGVTAGLAVGSVLGDAVIDAYALEAIEIFMLNVSGAFLAMTTLFRGDRAGTEHFRPVMAGSPSGTGQVTNPHADTKRAA